MDGVIVDFPNAVINAYNEQAKLEHWSPVSIEQWTHFEMSLCFGKEVHSRMEKIYNAPGFFLSLKPYPGAIEIVHKLTDIANVDVCSAPTKFINSKGEKQVNPYCLFDKVSWIHKHADILSKNMIMASAKHRVRANYLVDDGAHNIARWCHAHPEGTGILIDQRWNKNLRLPKNCIRANLGDVISIILEDFPDKDVANN